MRRPSITELYHLVEAIHDYNLDPKNREIFLFPPQILTEDLVEPGVEHTMSSCFIKNLKVLESLDRDSCITIHMKTCGGFFGEGMAIYDAIKASPCHITIINYSHARSMSSIILQAADHRIMMPNSHFMFHEGTYSDGGTLREVASNLEFYLKSNPVMLKLYSDRMLQKGKFSKWQEKKIHKMMQGLMEKKENVFLTAEETVEWGLADEICE